jgi:hypothetical protein
VGLFLPALALLAPLLLSVPAAASNTADVVGVWEPVQYTGHASRLVITGTNGAWTIHGYGACVPTSCDWGSVPLVQVSPYNPGAFDGWFAEWVFSFKQTYLRLSFEGTLLRVESIDVFTPEDGRGAYSVISHMQRVQGNSLEIQSSGYGVTLKFNREPGVALQTSSVLRPGTWVEVLLDPEEFEVVLTLNEPSRFYRLVQP